MNVIPSIAVVAEPFNHFKPTAELEKITMKTTPETYSGVAVVITYGVLSLVTLGFLGILAKANTKKYKSLN